MVPQCVPHHAICSGTLQKPSVPGGTPPPFSMQVHPGETATIHLFCVKGSRQHPDFPGGHPPEYYPSLKLLNFAERTGYGSVSLRWPSTSNDAECNYPFVSHVVTHSSSSCIAPLCRVRHGYASRNGYVTGWCIVCDMNPHSRAY